MASSTLSPPPKQKLPSTVLVIDDDPIVLRRVMKESLRNTNLAIITAENLREAADFLDSGPSIDAVLADFNFRSETQDPDRNLHDGIELLKYAQASRPNLPSYIMSMDAADRATLEMARRKQVQVQGWYDKLSSPKDQFPLWVRIERDLILQALKSKPAIREEARQRGGDPEDFLTDENLADKVRGIFNYPRLTYLQFVPPRCGVKLLKPIAVHCWPEEGQFLARAVEIPLLELARGEDAFEAVEQLSQMLVDELLRLVEETEANVQGYALYIKNRLLEHLHQTDEGELKAV